MTPTRERCTRCRDQLVWTLVDGMRHVRCETCRVSVRVELDRPGPTAMCTCCRRPVAWVRDDTGHRHAVEVHRQHPPTGETHEVFDELRARFVERRAEGWVRHDCPMATRTARAREARRQALSARAGGR